MKLRYYPFILQFRYPFRIAHGERKTTPVVYVEIEEDGLTGYGEAAMPPYLSESSETVCAFLSKVNLDDFSISRGIENIMEYVNSLQQGNQAAKAAVDIALHDLLGKTKGISLRNVFKAENLPAIYSTYTIGMGSRREIQMKISEAKDFRIFKIKLGGEDDKKIIEAFLHEMHNSPHQQQAGKWAFCVDVNQGWGDYAKASSPKRSDYAKASSPKRSDYAKASSPERSDYAKASSVRKDKYYALEMIHWLSEKGAFLVEQPLAKNMMDETAWLTEQSPIPVIADEAVQGLEDIEKIKGAYSGINIKLMKCGGLNEAKKMIDRAKELKMKLLIGCMSESSCAVTAAAHLSPFADWADLDGPYLIKNDPFDGMKIIDGKIFIPGYPGIGIRKIPAKP